jgi:hypothetical protein
MRAHRAIYKLFIGDIPKGLMVCHSCDVRNCINPKHLFIGTAKDNTKDMMNKGRSKFQVFKGEDHGRSALKDFQILEIRKKYATQNYSLSKLGKFYKTTKQTIWKIVRRKSWGHI